MIRLFYIVFIFSVVIVQNLNNNNFIEGNCADSEIGYAVLDSIVDNTYSVIVDMEDVEENKLKPNCFDFSFILGFLDFTLFRRIDILIRLIENFHLHFSDSSPPLTV